MIPPEDRDVPARPPRRIPVAARFWLVLGVLVAAMLVMGGLGFDGLARMADSAGGLRAAAAETKRDTVTRGHLVDLRSALQLYVATDDTDVARWTRQASRPRSRGSISRSTSSGATPTTRTTSASPRSSAAGWTGSSPPGGPAP